MFIHILRWNLVMVIVGEVGIIFEEVAVLCELAVIHMDVRWLYLRSWKLLFL